MNANFDPALLPQRAKHEGLQAMVKIHKKSPWTETKKHFNSVLIQKDKINL
jgi:hypothetical protein